jgi:hypothetical protein
MRRVAIALCVVAAVGCKKVEEVRLAPEAETPKPPVSKPAPSLATAELKIGGGDEAPPHLGFKIVKVYDGQMPTETQPGHADGGQWQFFDAITSDGAPFTFGWHAVAAKGDLPIAFGDGELATPARPRFVASLARAFGQSVPKAAGASRAAKPMKVRLVVLGQDVAAQPGGGYGGQGTAVATKLFFVGDDSADAEVFFNFNLAARTGEFSEKDADYDKDVVEIAAARL